MTPRTLHLPAATAHIAPLITADWAASPTPDPSKETPVPHTRALSDEAHRLLLDHLVATKRRRDLTLTRLVGVHPTSCYYQGTQTEAAIAFEVEFTYDNTPTTHRTVDLLWPIGVYHHPGEPDPNVPQALWDTVNVAIAATYPRPPRTPH